MTRPASMQTRRPTTRTSTCTMCSIQTTAMPRSRSSLTVATSSTAWASVRPPPISSSRSTRGSVASARASSSGLRSSNPSVSARRLARSARPQSSSASMQRSYAAAPRRPPPVAAPTKAFSNTVIPPNGRGTWCARPMPSRQRSAAPSFVTSPPASSTRPAFGRSEPASTFSSVVLPAPFGPTMPMASPGATRKSTPSSTTSAPKRLRTPTATRIWSIRRPRLVRLEVPSDRDAVIVGVLADDEVDLVLVPRLHPLTAGDRRRHDVPWHARARFRPVEHADRRLHLHLLQRADDGVLVLRIPARLQERGRDVEESEARPGLLVPLLAALGLVAVTERLRADAGQRRGVRPGRMPVARAREVVAESAELGHLRREEPGLRDLRDLHHLRVALVRSLLPERGEVGRDRERVEDLALRRLELGDLRRVVVRPVLVGARVDDRVARLLQQRAERRADRVAVSLVRPHHADLLVRGHLRPEMRVGVE